ncbi:MAG TPA: MFS transporter [Caulobacteraceae bacterium]|jgi:putative MFS transporter
MGKHEPPAGAGKPWAFFAGSALVAAGVLLHLPMFATAGAMGYRLAGMAMDPAMLWGMVLIVVGVAAAAYGLRPAVAGQLPDEVTVSPPEDAPLTRAHWVLMAVLAVALVIDIMKPASLGFVMPGTRAEYGLDPAQVAWLPLTALFGTVIGSFAWGWLADVYGRRASILLSSVMFVGTAICGAMPSFGWNLAMCLLMGAAAGGMLPVTYALLAETMPSKHRGWSLVLVGGLGAVGGYLAASSLSAWLQPHFGWRVMWLLNLPTGLLLIAMSRLLPESPKFLMHIGRVEQAHATLRRFGSVMTPKALGPVEAYAPIHNPTPPASRRFAGTTTALTVVALAWGLVNFGLLLWLPAELVARGYGVSAASRLISASSAVALPTVFAVAFLYSRWSTKWTFAASLVATALGLAGMLLLDTPFGRSAGPLPSLALLLVGANGVIAILLPYTAESYPLRVRGRAAGWVAGCSKFGGLIAQFLAILALTPSLTPASALILVPVALALLLLIRFCAETRGRDLRELDEARPPQGAHNTRTG